MGSLIITEAESKYRTLDDARYDARVMGIVAIGEQNQQPYKGQAKSPVQKLKFIFETPSEYNCDEGEEGRGTLTVSRAVPITCGDRSNLNKVLSAIKNTSLTKEQCEALVGDDDALAACLGSALQVDVASLENDDRAIRFAGAFIALDPRLKNQVAEATRLSFIFFPDNPDMKVWNEHLKYFLKAEIMKSNKSDTFPKCLHEQWVLDQEAEEVRKQERESGKSSGGDVDLGAIQ